MHGNMTYELRPHCDPHGHRDFKYSLNPGNYSCRAFDGAQLTIPRFEGNSACEVSCNGGYYLGLGIPATIPPLGAGPDERLAGLRNVRVRDYTEAQGALRAHELVCKQCPEGTFSVGGGKLIHRWMPEITGTLSEDVQQDGTFPADVSTTAEPEGSLPHEFASTCFGFNATAFQHTGSMTEAWVEGHLCEPWKPERQKDGKHITSGNNRGAPKVRSELHLRLRMVRPGKVWFSYSVDVDESPQAAEQCPWLNGDTGVVGQWKCADGHITNTSWDCNDHGGRYTFQDPAFL